MERGERRTVEENRIGERRRNRRTGDQVTRRSVPVLLVGRVRLVGCGVDDIAALEATVADELEADGDADQQQRTEDRRPSATAEDQVARRGDRPGQQG